MQRIALGADLVAEENSSLALQLQQKAALYAAEAEKKAQVSLHACMPRSVLTAGLCVTDAAKEASSLPLAAAQGHCVRCCD